MGSVARAEILKREPDSFFELLDEPDILNRSAFVRKFAPYLWTYIAGYRELVDRFVLVHHDVFDHVSVRELLKGWRKPAVSGIPESWKSALRDDEAYWTTLNPDQIDKACDCDPLRLDRACQIIKLLELVFHHSRYPELQSIDCFEFLQLRPAVYSFGTLASEPKHWLEHGSGDAFESLLITLRRGREDEKIKQSARALLGMVASGVSITRTNALLIQRHLEQAGFGGVVFNMLPARGRRRPCSVEPEFVSLEPSKLAKLNNLENAVAKPSRGSRVRK